MEILELIFSLLQGFGCCLEVMAISTDVGVGVAGVKARRLYKKRHGSSRKKRIGAEREGSPASLVEGLPGPAAEQENEAQSYERTMWVFLILLVLGVILTGFVLWKWLR